MSHNKIKTLFAGDIYRRIEEVIKVDQTADDVLQEELREYVVTPSIRRSYQTLLRRYWETLQKPHEGIAIWVSGFFGSGKSSFAKMLGLAVANRPVGGQPAGVLFGERTGDNEIQVLLRQIGEKIPTEAVIFDVSTDRGIKSGNQTLTAIMYRLFLRHLGYADDLDLAELEIALEAKGELDRFKEMYRTLDGQEWDENKDMIAFSIGEASQVMSKLYPDRYPAADSWIQGIRDRADITPGKLAERCLELMDRRRPGKSLLFVIDEVGQFVARDVQKMLDLQAVVQSLGRLGRGRAWIVVTSQEKLTELVSGLDDNRVELTRLMDRFPLTVHLEPADISEVTSRRVLTKKAAAEDLLGQLYDKHTGRLAATTRLTGDIQLPELTRERFIDLYPLIPYQIDLIIQVVSGLRTQDGASKHVGGANRTIIKLAQQLLIHEGVKLAENEVGGLARIDQIYDLVAGNLPSEIRGKIELMATRVAHPRAGAVAKAICLLQYVKSLHRTPENIAAALHPGVDSDSMLPEVKEALRMLIDAHQVRLSDGQYRIPTPAEDDWETTRAQATPREGDVNRLLAETLVGLWEPKPSHHLQEARTFKGGLLHKGRVLIEEDIPFHVITADAGEDFEKECAEARTRSQSEKRGVFWVVPLDEAIDREIREVHRSREILSRKKRVARTRDETSLVSEEEARQRRHESDLKRLLREALLAGSIYFRGNDRSPRENVTSITQAASRVLAQVLPEVFDRFGEGAAIVGAKDLEALTQNENLRGMTEVFQKLNLLKEQKGQLVFQTESGPLHEVLGRIENLTSYGESATGRHLAEEFSREPFGWSFDVVRLFVVTLVRAGKIKAVSQGTTIDSALALEARNAFKSNNLFKACSFHRKVSGTTIEDWLAVEDAFRTVFGKSLPQLEAAPIAQAIRTEIEQAERQIHEVLRVLHSHGLPGANSLQEAVDQIRALRTATDDDTLLGFKGGYRSLQEAIKRANELKSALLEPRLLDLARWRRTVERTWPALSREQDLPEQMEVRAESLKDLLARETFYRHFPEIEVEARAIEEEHRRRFDETARQRAEVYQKAIESLKRDYAWALLNDAQRTQVLYDLASRARVEESPEVELGLLRSDIQACPQRLRSAVVMMNEKLEGQLLVTLDIRDFFAGRLETPDQLEAALENLRHRVEKLLGEGKKVLIQ